MCAHAGNAQQTHRDEIMIGKSALITLALTSLLSVHAAQLFDVDFTAVEGFSEGAGFNNIASINAQANWMASDVGGLGYATNSANWTRARHYTGFTLEPGDSVVIETTLRLSGTSFPDRAIYMIGFAEASVSVGSVTPSLGSTITSSSDGSYWFGSADSELQRITVPAPDAADWIKFTQVITRSATSNEFTGIVSAVNLTKGVDLGSASSPWTHSTSDGSWGGTMRASFRALQSEGVELHLDRWSASTVEQPIQTFEVAVVNVDVTRKRAIGGFSALNRDTWFGIYQDTGYGEGRTVDGKDPEEWVYEDGNMLPSRGTWQFSSYWDGGGYSYFLEDPLRPGFIDTNEVYNTYSAGRLIYAKNLAPHHRTIMSGAGKGRYAEFICWPTNLTSGVLTVSNHQSHAEATSAYFQKIHDTDALMPYWYEVLNESDVPKNFGWHYDDDAWDKLAEFHITVADRMAIDWPEVKVAGPVDAWAYRDGKDGSFSSWNKANKKFIDLAGNSLGAYAFHAYEMDFTIAAQGSHATVYDAQFESSTIWSKGRIESFADLWENEHEIRWGDRKPFIISEYGVLSWDDVNYFSYIKACNSMLIALMDRPDIMDKMSVYIHCLAGWDPSQRLSMFITDDGGSTWYKSSAYNYLYFWSDLNGDYLFSSTDSYHVKCRAFLDGDQLYVILHNNYNEPFLINLQEALPTGTVVASAQVKTLTQSNGDVLYTPYAAVADLSTIVLDTEATAIVRLSLSNTPDLPVVYEENYYGNKVLEDINGGVDETFSINIPAGINDDVSNGTLYFSLHKTDGFSVNPAISVNGNSITNVPDITHSAGVVNCWKQFAVDVPVGHLQEGNNSIALQFPGSGGKITNIRLAVVGDGKHYISGTPLVGGGAQIEIPTVNGREYRLLRSANLVAGGWTPVTNFAGTGTVELIDDPVASDQQFYKVEMFLP